MIVLSLMKTKVADVAAEISHLDRPR